MPGSPTSDSIELESEEGRRFSAEALRWLEDFPHLLDMKQILGDLGAEPKMYGNPEGQWEQSEFQEWAPFIVRKSRLRSLFTHCGTDANVLGLK